MLHLSTGGLPDSSDPLEKALVRLVSQQGAERWEQKAEEFERRISRGGAQDAWGAMVMDAGGKEKPWN